MSDIHDWEGAINARGFREALLAYGRAEGQIKEGEGLPDDEDELKYMAAEAIESGETEFSLEDPDGERGSTDIRAFAGLYWMCDCGGISGPFASLEEAADAVLAMTVAQACPGFYSAASGAPPMTPSPPAVQSWLRSGRPSKSTEPFTSAPRPAW